MKKFFVIAAVVAASFLTLTSCDKDTKKCWEVTASGKIGAISISTTGYVWATQNEVEAQIEQSKNAAAAAGGEVTYKKKSVSKYTNEIDCLAQNPSDFDL